MRKKILFVACLVLGLMLINSGLNKFFNYMPMPDDLPESLLKVMNAFTEIIWLMPLVAVAEIIGGILLIIPRFRALGAIIIFPIMVGILMTHIFNAPSGLVMAVVLFAINLWALFESRQKYAPMFR